MPTSSPVFSLDADILTVTSTLGNEILLFAPNPQAARQAVARWAQTWDISLDFTRPLASYSGGEQVLLVAGLWAHLLAHHPPFCLDLRSSAKVLSPENRARLKELLRAALPHAQIVMDAP